MLEMGSRMLARGRNSFGVESLMDVRTTGDSIGVFGDTTRAIALRMRMLIGKARPEDAAQMEL